MPVPQELDTLFFGLPERLQPEAVQGLSSLFHFCLIGEIRGTYTVIVAGGVCHVLAGLHGKPRCVVEASGRDYLSIESGALSPETAFMTGRIKISNLAEMMRFVRAFRPLSAAS